MNFLQVLSQKKFEQIHWCTLRVQEIFPSMIQRLTACSVAGHCTVCCSSEAIELKDIKNFERALVVRVNN